MKCWLKQRLYQFCKFILCYHKYGFIFLRKQSIGYTRACALGSQSKYNLLKHSIKIMVIVQFQVTIYQCICL